MLEVAAQSGHAEAAIHLAGALLGGSAADYPLVPGVDPDFEGAREHASSVVSDDPATRAAARRLVRAAERALAAN